MQDKPMEELILRDQQQFPTEEVIYSYIGDTKALWYSFFEYLHASHPDLTEQWRYYKDGKSWLMKVVRKSKTIFWLSVIQGGFRITFYFTDKAEEAICESSISEELKEQFRNGKHYNKIHGLTITFHNEKDIEYAQKMLAIKLGMK